MVKWKKLVKWMKLGLALAAGTSLYLFGRCHGKSYTETTPSAPSSQETVFTQSPQNRHSSDASYTPIAVFVKGLEGRVDFDIYVGDERVHESVRDRYISSLKKQGRSNEEIFDVFCLADLMDGTRDYRISPENLQKFVEEDERKLINRYSERYSFLK